MNRNLERAKSVWSVSNVLRTVALASVLSLSSSARNVAPDYESPTAVSESFGESMLRRPEVKEMAKKDVLKRLREEGDTRPDTELEKDFEKYWNDPEFRKQIAQQVEEALGVGVSREREMLGHVRRLYTVFDAWAQQLGAGSEDIRSEEGKNVDPKELRESKEDAMKYLESVARRLERNRGSLTPLLQQQSKQGATKMDPKTFATIQSLSRDLREVEGIVNVYGNDPKARQIFRELWEWLKEELKP